MVGIRAKTRLGGALATADGAEKQLARGITAAMRETADTLKAGLRGDVVRAGLGSRLANTWQGRTYPQKAVSVSPTGFVWSKAPEIIGFYDSGQPIVPINGSSYLAIPAPAARAMIGRRGRRLTVAEVEARLGRPIIIIPGKNGHLLGLFDQSRTRTGRRKRGAGTKRDLVLLYTFVPVVAGRKRLDVAAEVEAAIAQHPANLDRNLA